MTKSDFIKDLVRIKREGRMPQIPTKEKNGLIYFHLAPIIETWILDFYDRSDEPVFIRVGVIREQLKQIPGFVATNALPMINGKVYRCAVFVKNRAPRELLEALGHA